MKIKGNNYKERSQFQLNEWVKGNSIHNDIDKECCPDFSCCKDVKTDKVIRETFKAAYIAKKYDVIDGILMGFLGNLLAKELPNKKVHMTDGNMSYKKELN